MPISQFKYQELINVNHDLRDEISTYRKYLKRALLVLQKVNGDTLIRIRVRRFNEDLAVIGRETEKQALILMRDMGAVFRNFPDKKET